MSKNGYHKVLILNSTHLPINITGWKRAVTMIYTGKAVGVEYDGKMLNDRYPLPLVVRLSAYVFVPYKEAVLSRKNIYLRDNYVCQYCGKNGGNLTVDHVLAKSRGGEDSWENLVTCCQRCNNRKGDRSLDEAGLKLYGAPYRPPSALYLHMTRISNIPESWYNYFFKSN